MTPSFHRYLLLLSASLLSLNTWAATSYPSPQGWVTDNARVLEDSSRQALENQLSQFERTTSVEMAVVTVPSLGDETIESYANALFSRWRIGKKDKNNGILILLAPNEHKTRIEVGYGLEAVLPDGLCGEIIRNQMIPYFKNGQYAAGLMAGVSAIQEILTQGRVPSAPARPMQSRISALRGLAVPFLVAFFFLPFTTLAVALAILLVIFLSSPLRFLGFLFVPLGIVLDVFKARSGGGGTLFDTGYYGGWGGGFGGGGFSGGDFGGFGGGSSGGGGASGGW